MLQAVLYILNLLDMQWTLEEYYSHKAIEANPLMAFLLERSPVLFVAVKIIAVGAGCFVLYKVRDRLVVKLASWALLMIYCYVAFLHLSH